MSSSPLRLADATFRYYARLRRVREYLEAHLSEQLSLTKAARIAGMNKTYFSQFFHEKTGMCFKQWVNSVRVEHAKRLMQSTNSSISNIAFNAGFGTLRTFERAFKRHTSQTPSDYKRGVQPNSRMRRP